MARLRIGETNMILAQIINVIYDNGPISAEDIADQIGRSREYVDFYIRQARELKLVHVDALVSRDLRHSVKLFVFGPGEDSVKRASMASVQAPTQPVKEMYIPRHDEAMLAFFGRAA